MMPPVASKISQLAVVGGGVAPLIPPLLITSTVNGAPLEMPLSVAGPFTLNKFQFAPFVPLVALS